MTRPKKTHCLRGHNIAEIGRHDSGECRQCHRDRVAHRKARQRQQERDERRYASCRRIVDFLRTLTADEMKLLRELVDE